MSLLAVIRHGQTAWNEAGRLQGRRNVPLSAVGRRLVERWRVPPRLADFEWVTSPLKRALETAILLAGHDVKCDDRLVEMDWAEWEGRKLEDLRQELGQPMADLEAKGLDFRAPGGESPRDVQRRLHGFLTDLHRQARPTVAVCHKGIIRALYALAADWDMTGKAPHGLQANCAHIFLITDGEITIEQLNLPLLDADE